MQSYIHTIYGNHLDIVKGMKYMTCLMRLMYFLALQRLSEFMAMNLLPVFVFYGHKFYDRQYIFKWKT